jgi:hypothetical protein
MVPIGKRANTSIELSFSTLVAVGSILKPKVLRGPDAFDFNVDLIARVGQFLSMCPQ